jgi:lipoprotein signal peptidase
MSGLAPAASAAEPARVPEGAAARPANKAWFWLPIAPLVALDLWSKAAAFGFLAARYPGRGDHARHLVWEGPVRFELVHWHNTGTIWGLFQGYNLALVIVRCLAVVLLVAYGMRRQPPPGRALMLVLGAILAGAVGNLYDNFTVRDPKGGVRDFLYFTFFPGTRWEYGFPAFNVADACISVGVLCLVVSILFEGSRKDAGVKPAA